VQGGEQTGLDGAIYPIKATAEHPEGGSTDVGDISWNVRRLRCWRQQRQKILRGTDGQWWRVEA